MILIDNEVAAQNKLIAFPDVKNDYQPMFYVRDGEDLSVRLHDGEVLTRSCKYLDPYHFNFGTNTYHKDQFAELNARNGNTCEPVTQISDLSLFRRFFADRELKGEDGKPVPYRALVGFEPDRFRDPSKILAVCPEADTDRQVCLYTRVEESGFVKAIEKEFCSIHDAMSSSFLLSLPMNRHETKLVSAVLEEAQRQAKRGMQKRKSKTLDQQIAGAKQRTDAGSNQKEHAAHALER